MSEQEKTNMMRAQYHEQIALQNNSMSHMAQQNTELVGQVSYLMKKVEFLGTENVYLRQKVAEHDVSIQSLQSEMTQMHQTMQQMQQWFHQQQQ